jgi:hypothetical protein
VLTNAEVNLFNKQTGAHLYEESHIDFFSVDIRDSGTIGDGYPVWDVFRKRFYFLLLDFVGPSGNVTVDAPSPVAGDYIAAVADFTANVNVSSTMVEANPINGCTALINAAAMVGNIAFIRRGGCTFAQKATNAFNAGAIGFVCGNSVVGLTTMAGSVGPVVNITSVMIQKSDFDAILPYLPTNGSITLPGDPLHQRSLLWTATSKGTQPTSKTDFHIYNAVTITDGHDVLSDFPKIATGPKALFVTDDQFNDFSILSDNTKLNVRVTAFDADDMANGVGATMLWTTLLNATHTHYPVRFVREEDGWLYPNYFVAVNYNGLVSSFNISLLDSIILRWADETGVDPTVVIVPIPLPIRDCNFESIFGIQGNFSGGEDDEGVQDESAPTNLVCSILGRQPFPLDFENQLEIIEGTFATGVLSKGFIYTAVTTANIIEPPSVGYSSIIWLKIDVRTTNVTHTASVVDSGLLDLGRNFDLGFPAVSVDEYDNMLINFQVSGPTLPQSFGVIGRKDGDPPGTLRYPPKLVVKGAASYSSGGVPTRQGDYTGLQADPDCFTEPFESIARPKCDFYGIGQHPLDGVFLEPGLLGRWSTSFYRATFHPKRTTSAKTGDRLYQKV